VRKAFLHLTRSLAKLGDDLSDARRSADLISGEAREAARLLQSREENIANMEQLIQGLETRLGLYETQRGPLVPRADKDRALAELADAQDAGAYPPSYTSPTTSSRRRSSVYRDQSDMPRRLSTFPSPDAASLAPPPPPSSHAHPAACPHHDWMEEEELGSDDTPPSPNFHLRSHRRADWLRAEEERRRKGGPGSPWR
jgi:hypothetical protein